MYDYFTDLSDNREIARTARTRFYWLGTHAPEHPTLTVPRHDHDKNFIFTYANGVDRYYLLQRAAPDIGVRAKRLQTQEAIQACFDVVFIENGEACAPAHYEALLARNLPNQVHRISGVDGRNNAYRAAAKASSTPYFFAVFAKLDLLPEFDFGFGIAPWDRRHYVFKARNPVNGLCYGHQGLILYNKEQVLANPGTALDFTMAQSYHELDVVCGTAHYNTSELAAWRCAFREVLKLCVFDAGGNAARIEQWQTGEGAFSAHSIQGARDALRYYAQHQDDPKALQRSYDWPWLEQHFKAR